MGEVTGKFTKIAWIHDGPPAVRSLGHFNCPCGTTISDVEYAGPDVTCGTCGRVWDGRGWLVSEPQEDMRGACDPGRAHALQRKAIGNDWMRTSPPVAS